ncbi:hypothetical protein GQ53DRAFT_750814 [Thozetella sp. PMI_491]|nr:hypothetical protein GQ53DRAFT_750814 [Thozetella sp. PMI_491]
MSYNPYGAPPYGAPPGYGSFPGSTGAPGMAPPPGLAPPPGMSSAPGMAPPGVQQSNNAPQANRPSGLPSFQPPSNLPNINFNAPVIRLGTTNPPAKSSDRKDAPRQGRGDGNDLSRPQARDSIQTLLPPTNEERLRTIFLHKIPEGAGNIERLLRTVGNLRRWDSAQSQLSDHKGKPFGFAQFDDPDSLSVAIALLKDLEVPAKKQAPTGGKSGAEGQEDGPADEVEKVKLQVTVDPSTEKYLESWEENRDDTDRADAEAQLANARAALEVHVQGLFFPKATDADGDASMADAANGDNVEVINIPLAQEDELADIPAEMREIVSQEIAAFRERSNRRDLERLRKEEEMEELERQRSGAPPAQSPINSAPLGPRVPNAPSGPRGNRIDFVNGHEEDTDASDDELQRREVARQKSEEDKIYVEAERKWVNRERQRGAALDREREREKSETEGGARRREEQLAREREWDDDREASRKGHLYYRDHGAWIRKRTADRADEEARDDMDRQAEQDERRREAADMEHARGMADSFLEQQAEEMAQPAAAPQRFTISFGAAAQKAQAQRAGPQRRTIAEVEGLLDDEEHDQTAKRQLIPIKFEPLTDTKAMSEEDLQKAVRALAQEIPTEKDGLWAWEVKWDYLEESTIEEKLLPFVEKKVVEYLGVQEQFLVDVVVGHLRKHQKPGELVEELSEALDDDAEDLVKKLWRMVIFFTESEKRGLPA